MNVITGSHIERRTFLKGMGASVALPFLDAMVPAGRMAAGAVDDPTRFVLYEAYRSAADADAHKQTAHYLAWRDTVAEMMAQPREGIPMRGIRP